MNPKTLEIIGRKNLPMDQYKEVQNEIKKRGMPSIVELIAPLPEENWQSFTSGIKQLIEANVNKILVHTTILLKNTKLDSDEMREKYGMETRFRVVPRQFGEYDGQKCFEIEEVCIATNTMSYDQYLSVRGFFFVLSILSSKQFDIIRRHLEDLDIAMYDFVEYVWGQIKLDEHLQDVYSSYLRETNDELWDSPELLCAYFSKEENYNKLLNGDLGDNLIRKYSTEILLNHHHDMINLLYNCISDMGGSSESFMDDTRKWMLSVRQISDIIDKDKINSVKELKLSNDVQSWYEDGGSYKQYKKDVSYELSYDVQRIKDILKEGKSLFGDDELYSIGKLLINFSPSDFWRKVKNVKQ